MASHEILLRTMNAAKEARENGFMNTADAFDEIATNLLNLLRSHSQSEDVKAANANPFVFDKH